MIVIFAQLWCVTIETLGPRAVEAMLTQSTFLSLNTHGAFIGPAMLDKAKLLFLSIYSIILLNLSGSMK